MPEHNETKILDPTALGLIAALAAVVLYVPAIQFGWVWDDKVLVTSQGHTVLEGYRPLAALLFRLEWSLGYGTPLIAHLTSVLLHGVATFLFFRLALSLTAGPVLAFVTSLLFAAHPVHVEAVAYISGRPDLLATTLALLALLIARREEFCTPEGCRSLKIWAAYIAYGAALLSDEVALATPFVLVGLDRWGPKPVPFRWRRTHYSGFLAITLVYLLVRFVSGSGFASAAGAAAIGIEPAARVWSVPMAIFESLRVLFVPHPLNALRTLTAADVASTANRIAPFLALLGVAIVVALRRHDPLARAGGLLLLIPLVPSLPIPPFVGSYVEERSLYFASVGACLLVGSIYSAVRSAMPRAGLALAILACGVAAAAGFETQMRLPVWKDNTTLLLAAAKADPKDPLPHIMLADYFSNDENWPAAESAIDRAVELDPNNHGALVRQVAILNRRGKFEQSAIAAHRALAIVPNDAMTLTNLSDALVHTDKAAEGAEAAGRAVALDSTLVNAWYNYGVSLAAAGRIPEAIAAYRKTVALEPGHILALNNLGALLGQSGQLVEARDLYRRLVVMAPNSVEAHMNLALVYLRLGDKNAASRERETVRRLSPNAVQQLDAVFREYQSSLPVVHPSRPMTR